MRGSLVLLHPRACTPVAEHAAIGHSTGGGVEIRLTFWTSSYRFLYSSSFMFCASDVASALFLAVSHLQSQRGVRATLLWNGIAYSAEPGWRTHLSLASASCTCSFSISALLSAAALAAPFNCVSIFAAFVAPSSACAMPFVNCPTCNTPTSCHSSPVDECAVSCSTT